MNIILAFIFLITVPCFSQTSITGNIKDLGGNVVASKTKVRAWLRGCNGNNPRVNGAAIIAPSIGGQYYFDFTPDTNGLVSGTLYSNDTQIECGGSVAVTWYGIQIFFNGIGGPEIPAGAVNGQTLNLTNFIPLSATPVVATPTGDGTYARLDAGNQPFRGPISIPKLDGFVFVDSVVYTTLQNAINALP